TVPSGKSFVRLMCQITGNTVQAQANFDDASLTRTVPGGGYTYLAPPSLTSISPSSGPVAGGTAVTLTGSSFRAGATVMFGTTAASAVTVVNSTKITTTTPAESAGPVSVTVTNPDSQSSTLNNGFTFAAAIPTISSITPASG